ncbi:hypothetical protein EON64_10715 [archaeon]|nr:MAG: hypothetical protein EON64_10715 [archaeon]
MYQQRVSCHRVRYFIYNYYFCSPYGSYPLPLLLGFSNESVITIGTLFLVVGAVERSHVVDWIARKTFGSEGWVVWNKMRMYAVCFLLSTFFNNTPLVAILLPVVKDWGRMRGIAASQLLMPLSYFVIAVSGYKILPW